MWCLIWFPVGVKELLLPVALHPSQAWIWSNLLVSSIQIEQASKLAVLVAAGGNLELAGTACSTLSVSVRT